MSGKLNKLINYFSWCLFPPPTPALRLSFRKGTRAKKPCGKSTSGWSWWGEIVVRGRTNHFCRFSHQFHWNASGIVFVSFPPKCRTVKICFTSFQTQFSNESFCRKYLASKLSSALLENFWGKLIIRLVWLKLEELLLEISNFWDVFHRSRRNFRWSRHSVFCWKLKF